MKLGAALVLLAACRGEPASDTRCTIRVHEQQGILVDGVKHTAEEAVALCKKTAGAVVEADDGVAWDELRAALQATRTKIYVRGVLWDGSAAPTNH